MRIAFAAVLAAFLLSGCVEARPVTQIAERCGHRLNWYPNFKVEVRRVNKDVELLERYMDAADTIKFNKAYNETPPQSSRVSAHVAVWMTREALDAHLNRKPLNNTLPTAVVVWIEADGCIQAKEVIPLLILEYLLRGHPYIPGGRES